MSCIVFDFLTESFLFNSSYIEDGYSKFSDRELQEELLNYREYVINNVNEIFDEVKASSNLTNTTIESFGYLPDLDMLKRLALYIDRVVIPDPLFECTDIKSDSDNALNEYLNLDYSTKLDRIKIVDAIKYMKGKTELTVRKFIVYFPISQLHERDKELPLKYSKTAFSDILSENIMEFFYDRAIVSNVAIENGKFKVYPNEKLKVGTAICVDFDKDDLSRSGLFQYMKSEIVELNEKTGRYISRNFVPDNISVMEFNHWVHQSVNQTAIKVYDDVFKEQVLARELDCMYLTSSQLVANLLKVSVPQNSINAELANLGLQFQLPVIHNISLEDIIRIRYDNGEAFHNFRNELNARLLELRGVDDSDELIRRIENISYQMNEIQVNDVDKEIRKLRKMLGLDTVILTGSLITGFLSGGIGLMGAAGAVLKGGIDYGKYKIDTRENNSYFLWKLNKKAWK